MHRAPPAEWAGRADRYSGDTPWSLFSWLLRQEVRAFGLATLASQGHGLIFLASFSSFTFYLFVFYFCKIGAKVTQIIVNLRKVSLKICVYLKFFVLLPDKINQKQV
jgi:hypothetical protein